MDTLNIFMESPITHLHTKIDGIWMYKFNIIKNVCDFFDQPTSVIISKCNKREYVVCRHACMWVLRKKTWYSLEEIGNFLNKDHTAIRSGIKCMETWMEQNEEIEMYMKLLLESIPHQEKPFKINAHLFHSKSFSPRKRKTKKSKVIETPEIILPSVHHIGSYSNHSPFQIAN